MGPQDWKALQVTFETADIPPEDDVIMAKSSSSLVYNKYVKAAHSSENWKNKLKTNPKPLFECQGQSFGDREGAVAE